MGTAWVHTDAIKRFAATADRLLETVTNSTAIGFQVREIRDNIKEALRVLPSQLPNCMEAEARISAITEQLQREYEDLENRREELLECEPDPETEPILVTEYDEYGREIGTDEDEVETTDHFAWRHIYDSVREQRDETKKKLRKAIALRDEIHGHVQELDHVIQMLYAIMEKNEECLQRFQFVKKHISDNSEYAVSQLKKAIEALNKYLNEYVAVDYPTYSVKQIMDSSEAPFIEKGSDSANSDKRYGPPVVIEMDITFTANDHKEKTVYIKRRVYQYYEEIDFDYVRKNGQTNRQAMLDGKAPVVIRQGKAYILDLHHLSQVENNGDPNARFSQGGLAEVCAKVHINNTRVLHIFYPRKKGIRYSFRVIKNPDHTYSVSDDAKQFDEFRKQYWKKRVRDHDQMVKK